uniref:Uncharacterized protein n=1 Tax=Oryza sativa subsp. japonica TaxID=39947 RepID=Q6YT79_ORYSJ|nr:hypothetical protein [Oryza sativa Japonica Group]BAD31389.1 hypothetical protein [Oryza sativa Japonica Group]
MEHTAQSTTQVIGWPDQNVCDIMPRSVDVNGMVMAKLRIEVGERSKSIPGEDDGRLMKESGDAD